MQFGLHRALFKTLPEMAEKLKKEVIMDKIINTPCGSIQNTDCRWDGVRAFKGIRYATAGRWEYPVPVIKWEGTYDATRYGSCCYQPRAFTDEAKNPGKAFYYNEFRKGETYTYSEDCLFLNVFTPGEAGSDSRLPVIVYIHGGGFTGGCGHEKHFDGPAWAKKGVVAVTINYRLGPMGFVCLPELKEEAGHTGNYGLYDQVAALQWVQRNISAFGGDPQNVTIMGQSAGAMSVQSLCFSPLTEGLFHKAVMSSGGGISRIMNNKATPEDRYALWQCARKEAVCCDDLVDIVDPGHLLPEAKCDSCFLKSCQELLDELESTICSEVCLLDLEK